MEELAKLAYEASLRALDKQEDVVRDLRARAGVVLAAASFAISLATAAGVRFSPVAVIGAVITASASLAATLYVLLPRRSLVFALDGDAILRSPLASADTIGEVHADLVRYLSRSRRVNERVIGNLIGAFRLSIVALSVEIALLLVGARSTL